MTKTMEQAQQQQESERGQQRSQPGGGDDDARGETDAQLLALAGGALLVMFGLRARSLPGALMVVGGGMMIRRAWMEHGSMRELLGMEGDGEAARPEEYFQRGIHVEHSVRVGKSPEELFAYWRNFENLPRIMSHLESVMVLDGNRSHWVAKAPAGQTVEWPAEIINEEANRLIAWRSLGNADVDNAGSVRFVPAEGEGGTDVKVVMDYIPPAGRVGAFVAGLFGENPEQQIREDLERFKQLMEGGDVAAAGAQQGQESGAT
jgi:uncharacterized membrane protein